MFSATLSAILTVIAGSPQSATVNTAFATAFKVQITDALHNPISGVTVTFTAPSTGASGTFSSNAVLTTDATGSVTASTFTANTVAGAYQVGVAGGGLTGSLSLTNNAGPANLISIGATN